MDETSTPWKYSEALYSEMLGKSTNLLVPPKKFSCLNSQRAHLGDCKFPGITQVPRSVRENVLVFENLGLHLDSF